MDNDAQSLINLIAAQQYLLRERLYLLLATLHPVLRADVVRALEEEGKLLSQPSTDVSHPHSAHFAGIWSLLTLLVAQHVSPDIDRVRASSVAVAVECFVCAIDLLDDVIDGDQTSIMQSLGSARVVNVSTALLIMAQQAILSLSQQGIAPPSILRLLDTLQESALVTTAGQQRDVLAEQRPSQTFTYEECIEIAAAKAGSIMRLACRLGAMCAGADDIVCEQFSELGELLGISHQLDNDCHDLYYLLESGISAVPAKQAENFTRSVKSDLVRQKKTLPIVLAAHTETSLQGASVLVDNEKKEEHLQALHEGIISTWGICLLYRERARDRLQEIEAQRYVAPALRLLLGFE